MIGDIVTREIFRAIAEDVAKDRENENGSPCLTKDCPDRQTKCSGLPANVVPFRRKPA